MLKFAGSGFGQYLAGSITPDNAAYCCLRDLGIESVTNGHWVHEISKVIIGYLSDWVFNYSCWRGWSAVNQN